MRVTKFDGGSHSLQGHSFGDGEPAIDQRLEPPAATITLIQRKLWNLIYFVLLLFDNFVLLLHILQLHSNFQGVFLIDLRLFLSTKLSFKFQVCFISPTLHINKDINTTQFVTL